MPELLFAAASLSLLGGALGVSVAAARAPREYPPSVPPPKPFIGPTPALRILKNGMKVLVIERHSLPVLTLRLVIETGAEADPPELPGTAQIVAGLLNEGTADRTALQIAEAVDDAGGNVDNGADWDQSYLALSVLSDHAGLAFDLAADMTLHPAFAPPEVERARKQLISSLELLRADPSYVADVVFKKLEYMGTRYGHPPDGTAESARHFDAADLRSFHGRYYRPSNALLAVVGDISTREAFERAEKYFGGWSDTSETASRITAEKPRNPPSRIIIIDKPEAVETEIRVGNRGIGRTSPDYYALAVANQILGGPAANRLFKALRTRHGLTYGASSDLVCYRALGSWEAKTSTQTAETIKSVKMVLDEMGRLRNLSVSDQELEYAKNYLIGHLAIEFESSEGIAEHALDLMLHNLPPDYWNRFPEKIRALRVEDVSAAVRRYLDPDEATIVLVGNVAGFEKGLKKLGPVRVVPLRELDLGSRNLERSSAP